jgi:hypothetical protein
MCRRVFTLFLIPAFLLQGVATCHAQFGMSCHEHSQDEQQPHFHLSMIGLDFHAEKQPDARLEDQSNGREEQALKLQNAMDHDADAVYFSANSIAEGKSACDTVDSRAQVIPVAFEPPLDHPLIKEISLRLTNLPSPPQSHPCPLYLRALRLII